MSSVNQVDIHEELAGADVTPLHKALGVLITLITLFVLALLAIIVAMTANVYVQRVRRGHSG